MAKNIKRMESSEKKAGNELWTAYAPARCLLPKKIDKKQNQKMADV